MLFALKRYSQCSNKESCYFLIVPLDVVENSGRKVRDIKCAMDKSATSDTLLFL
jgi:hypothetical protein